ncbi:MAG TPA: Stp1/IreP family PP2C-type Ser/Thr phosphatase [Gaiellaceae bacterium]|jgi:protein phosphatase
MSLRTAHLTHPGRKRRHNEDSYVHQPPLFAIADGMGGAKAGEVASGLAVEALQLRPDLTGDDEAYVVDLIQEANRRVYTRAHEDAEASGMGTTMTVALVDGAGEHVTFGHVGDSRAYRVRDDQLEQLTDDHSLVGELIRSGKLTREEADVHPQRSVITRALGTDPDVDVDTFVVDAQPGDIYLLCSDGLSGMVSDDSILMIVRDNRRDLQAAAKALIAAANRGGGDDNITVVVFAVDGDDGDVTTRMDAIPPPAEDEPEAQDEDEETLSGLEPVPAVGTMVVSVEELQQQAGAEADEPPEERRRRRRGTVLAVVALLAFLAVLALLLLWAAASGGAVVR